MRGRFHRAWQTSVSIEQKCEHIQGGWWGAYVSGTCPCHAKDKKGSSAHCRLGTAIAWGVSSAPHYYLEFSGAEGLKGLLLSIGRKSLYSCPSGTWRWTVMT